ncbi:MAG: murein biosynthesis integral membrane protein MurJ [Desulfovibrio sp.]|jgi:putative peptidoglycan lipid II flippase|nr:murein biosynthesis integral membrane protein MurJ [Desulfovibrio sp.]
MTNTGAPKKNLLTRTQGMGAAALALGVGVLLSRVMGLVRDKIIAYNFGTSAEADIYFAAFTVPDFLNYLMAGGYFSVTLVPLLSAAFAEDEADARRFFSAAVCWAALCIVVLTAGAWAAAPFIAPFAAPGFAPEAQARLVFFLRIILPAQACFLPGACFTALLYCRRQFAVPALTPLVYNGCIILFGVLGRYCFPERGMEGFCWGVTAGAFSGALCLPVLAVRAGGAAFAPCLLHPHMKQVFFLALPLMLGQSIVALDEQLVRVFGSLAGEGGVSLLSYARRIMQVPVGVVAQAAGVASYPFLAALAARGERERFAATLHSAAGNTLLVALPLTLWMQSAAGPIMRLIFRQGDFSAQAASESGLLLSILLLGVPFWAVQQVAGRAFYAHRDTLTPALVGTLAALAALPLYVFGARHLGAAGVAGAGVAGVALYTLGICLRLRGKLGISALGAEGRKAAAALLCSLPAGLCALGAQQGAAYLVGAAYSADAAESLLCAAVQAGLSAVAFALVFVLLARRFAPFLYVPLCESAVRAHDKFLKKKS